KMKAADAVGIAARDHLHPGGLTQAALLALLGSLTADRAVHGILLQLPLPKGLDEDEAIAAIVPEKDVDGLHPTNLGRLPGGSSATWTSTRRRSARRRSPLCRAASGP